MDELREFTGLKKASQNQAEPVLTIPDIIRRVQNPRESSVCFAFLAAASLICATLALGQSGFKITGIVLDASSATVPGASVMLFSEERLQGTTTADSRGHFELTDIPRGTYGLEISRPGFHTVSFDLLEIIDRDVEAPEIKMSVGTGNSRCIGTGSVLYEKPLESASLVGTVLDDFSGSPAPGVIVTLSSGRSSGKSEIRVTSDEKGNFSFPKMEPGRYGLEAISSRDNYLMAFASLRIPRQNLTKVTLDIPPGCAHR